MEYELIPVDDNEDVSIEAPYGYRTDGTPKGVGYFDFLERPDGRISTELSIGVDFGEGEEEIPLLVPSLSSEEILSVLEGNDPTEDMVDKAIGHALMRKRKGLNPFHNDGSYSLIPIDEEQQTIEDNLEETIDPEYYFNYRRDQLKSNVDPTLVDRPELGHGTRSVWRSFKNIVDKYKDQIDLGSPLDTLMNLLADPTKDLDRIDSELQQLQQLDSDLLNTPEGKQYYNELINYSKDILDSEEMPWSEALDQLGDLVIDAPSELIDMMGAELINDPALIPFIGLAWKLGGAIGGGAAAIAGIGKIINKLRKGGALARAAAKALEESVEISGVAVGEGALGAGYEVARSYQLGGDPYKNVEAMAAVGALLGGGARGLRGVYEMLHGLPGGYRTPYDFVKDLTEKTSIPESAVVEEFTSRVYKGEPFHKVVNDMLARQGDMPQRKADLEPVESGIPSIPKINKNDMDVLYDYVINRAKKDWKINEDSIYYRPSKKIKDPVSTSFGQRKIFLNRQRLESDFDANLRWLRGETKKQTPIRSSEAALRQAAFSDIDMELFRNWLGKKGGAPIYADLLLKTETGRMRLADQGLSLTPSEQYRLALVNAVEQMGGKISEFKKRSVPFKWTQAIATATGRGAVNTVIHPIRTLEPYFDFIKAPIDFGLDLYRTAKDPETFNRDRYVIDRYLREWDGSKESLDIPIAQFEDYMRNIVGNKPEVSEAMLHFGEGNLARWNKARAYEGLDPIKLTAEQKRLMGEVRTILNKTLRAVNRLEGNPRAIAFRPNYMPHMIKHRKLMTEEETIRNLFADTRRGLHTTTGHGKQRVHSTLMDAEAAGVEFQTKDFPKTISSYLKAIHHVQLNKELKRNLLEAKTPDGHALVTTRDKAPKGYKPFKHPDFKDKNGHYYYVNPNIAPELRLYFDTSNPSIARRMLTNIIQISKRLVLSWSAFHIMALGWSALATGMNPSEVVKSVFPLDTLAGKVPGKVGDILQARLTPAGKLALYADTEYKQLLFQNGIRVGVVEELRGDALINALRGLADYTDKLIPENKYVKPLGKVVAAPIKGTLKVFARSQEIVDNHLWDHVASTMKMMTATTELEKLVLRDAARAERTGTNPTPLNELARRAAQFTNDAYGNQNWQQMAMNVQSAMGHRVAAALNRPTTREYIRMLVFAPDWTLSNVRVVHKIFDRSKHEHAKDAYLGYTIRSAMLFAFIGDALQRSAGQGSLFHKEQGETFKEWLIDALRPDLGYEKQLELSKQLSEVVRLWIYGPAHFAKHKLGVLPKSIMEADSLQDVPWVFAKKSLPIGMKQAYEDTTAGLAGVAGVPIYGK